MAGPRDPSHPPSDPRPVAGTGGFMSRAAHDRSVRVQFAAALVVGLVLFATGLYLWRRPHAPADAAEGLDGDAETATTGDASPVATAAATVEAGTPSPVTLSDARVVG